MPPEAKPENVASTLVQPPELFRFVKSSSSAGVLEPVGAMYVPGVWFVEEVERIEVAQALGVAKQAEHALRNTKTISATLLDDIDFFIMLTKDFYSGRPEAS